MAKICPNCGKELKDKAEFCGKCGKKLDVAEKKPLTKDPIGFIKAKKGVFIGVGTLLLAVVLLLIIINPSNSPKGVFNQYLSCMRSENADQYLSISYEANFSRTMSGEEVANGYRSRFSSADDSYKSGGKVNLLSGKSIKILEVTTPKQSEISTRRAALSEYYRNTARITDIRNITFEIRTGSSQNTAADGEQATENKPLIGTAEAICVTGKWYIAEVTGI